MASHNHKTDGELYEIRLQGLLKPKWSAWLDGQAISHEPDGTTTLTGVVTDQAALHGLLKKIRDLGVPLIAVNRINPDTIEEIDNNIG